MKKITSSQKQILSSLVFPESFDTIKEETAFQTGTIRDDLMQLLHMGLIKTLDAEKKVKISPYYDLDNVQDYLFQATQRGLKYIQLN